ncbi:hypothetical protein D3C84_553780 [compost metagenome]
MTLPALLRPLPRLGDHGSAALAAEAVAATEGGQLPGAARETKALLIPRHHQLAQRHHGRWLALGIRPQIQQIAGQIVPLVEALERGLMQVGGELGTGALWDLPLFIQQDEMIAPQHEPAGLFG